jgi:Ca2+-binding EF-hand superfamily protein
VPPPELVDPLRVCDAGVSYDELFGMYDADGDGDLDAGEQDAVFGARDDRPDPEAMLAMGWWMMLLAVYDLDGDEALSSDERATLLDDFTTRCDTLQAQLLADFDADGDGELDDEEEEAARAALEADMADMPAPGEPPREPPPEPGSFPPPLLDEFDTDGDGAMSDEELTAMRDTIRGRIRAGDPFFPPPPV